MWNSLEIAKLGVSLLTPILLFVLGIMVNRTTRSLEQAQWTNQRLIERRIELHQLLAPKLNDLYCFFTFVGHFRSIDPPTALQLKRDVDRVYFANEHLFSHEFGAHYREFFDSYFHHWSEPGRDAKLRVSADRARSERSMTATWERSWDDLFDEEGGDIDGQRAAYHRLMESFARELGVTARSR